MTAIQRLLRFIRDDLWQRSLEGAGVAQRLLFKSVRVAYMTVEGFLRDLCTTRAAALTFTSMLAFVPVLALAFAVLRGLGWHGARLEALILDRITLLSPEAIRLIVSYVDNVNFAGLGVFGGLFLLVTFISVVSSVEAAFNAIWGGAPARTLGRRVTDYFGVLVVAPVLLVAATSLTAVVQSNTLIQWMSRIWGISHAVEGAMALASWAVVWVLFTFLYLFVPNTRVRFVPAVVGAVTAGTVWQLTQWTYIQFQIGLANYNAIYGALAQLPMLMAWIYVSWVIVLFGAELAYSVQTVHVYARERRVATRSAPALRELVAMAIAIELARAAEGLADPPTVDSLAELLDVPTRTVREILASFHEVGIAHTIAAPPEHCYLSLAPERIPVTRIVEAVRGRVPSQEVYDVTAPAAVAARHVLELMTAGAEERFGTRTLKDVALDVVEPSAARPVASVERADFGTGRRDRRRGGA